MGTREVEAGFDAAAMHLESVAGQVGVTSQPLDQLRSSLAAIAADVEGLPGRLKKLNSPLRGIAGVADSGHREMTEGALPELRSGLGESGNPIGQKALQLTNIAADLLVGGVEQSGLTALTGAVEDDLLRIEAHVEAIMKLVKSSQEKVGDMNGVVAAIIGQKSRGRHTDSTIGAIPAAITAITQLKQEG